MRKYQTPDEALAENIRDLENFPTAKIWEVYLAHEVDAEIGRLKEALRGIAKGMHAQGGWLTGAEMMEIARLALKL